MSVSTKKKPCVFGCDQLGAAMHGFPHPVKKPELLKSWLSIVGDKLEETDPWKIYKNKKVCDHHFTPDQKVTGHRLIYMAVPTVNLDGEETRLTQPQTINISLVSGECLWSPVCSCLQGHVPKY